jgi:gamma-glutamylcyclotransferase (GGCT)/AIG2-like uncharacterized protein YtfP
LEAATRDVAIQAIMRDPIMPQSTPRHVFVYGTLRRGQANDITRLSPAPRFVGCARIAATLYDFGRYPGAVLGGTAEVVGEVYAIAPELERMLDEIEEIYPQQRDEYFKRELEVAVAGVLYRCLVYEINTRYVDGTRRISSGDWAERGPHDLEM